MNKNRRNRVSFIISKAENIASRVGDGMLHPEHILLAFIDTADSECMEIIEDMGVNISELISKIHLYLEKLEGNKDIKNVDCEETRVIHTEETSEILAGIYRELKQLGDEYSEEQHLFLSMLRYGRTYGIQLMAKAGVDYIIFKEIWLRKKKIGYEYY